MKIAIAGSSGHVDYVLEALREDDSLSVRAVSPAVPGEDIADLLAALDGMGQWPQVFERPQEMIRQRDIDIVTAAGPFYSNAAIAREAMLQGKAVFCEKPVALTLEELDDLRRVQREIQSPLCAMMGLRSAPHLSAARRLMQEGTLGEPVLVTAQKSYKLGNRPDFYTKRDTYGGTIPWVAIHAIDWCSWLTGKRFIDVTARHGLTGNRDLGEMESAALMLFTLEDGVFASVSADYLRPAASYTHGDDRVRVAGTKGVLEVRAGHSYVTLEHSLPNDLVLEPVPGFFTSFAGSLQGRCPPPINTEDSLYITAAALLAREAADTGKTMRFADYGW